MAPVDEDTAGEPGEIGTALSPLSMLVLECSAALTSIVRCSESRVNTKSTSEADLIAAQ